VVVAVVAEKQTSPSLHCFCSTAPSIAFDPSFAFVLLCGGEETKKKKEIKKNE